jgi:hypothetical protein
VSEKYTSSVFGEVIAARAGEMRVLEAVYARGVARGARVTIRGGREAR